MQRAGDKLCFLTTELWIFSSKKGIAARQNWEATVAEFLAFLY